MEIRQIESSDLLRWAIQRYGDSFAIVTSFQAEGMVVVDLAARISRKIRVITVDTGRLPEATHEMIDRVRDRYGLKLEVAMPDPDEVEGMVLRHGSNLFRDDASLRMLCCDVRKVRPLDRKLKTLSAWAVGLRRGQSASRREIPRFAIVDGRAKLSPLADWTKRQVDEYIEEHDVPRHPLYSEGYASIGCDPCTRAVRAGEDDRAGRWWWEQNTIKECGIHFNASGKAERKVDVLLREILEPQQGLRQVG